MRGHIPFAKEQQSPSSLIACCCGFAFQLMSVIGILVLVLSIVGFWPQSTTCTSEKTLLAFDQCVCAGGCVEKGPILSNSHHQRNSCLIHAILPSKRWRKMFLESLMTFFCQYALSSSFSIRIRWRERTPARTPWLVLAATYARKASALNSALHL